MAEIGLNNFAAGDNAALARRARDRRFMETATHSMPSRALGGPQADPAWDAFFESIADTGGRVNFGGFGRPASSPGVQTMPTPQTRPARNPFFDDDSAAANMALGDYTDRSHANAASLRALEAQARISEDAAHEADFAEDPYHARAATGRALERQGAVDEFGRGERVKDAANLGAEYMAGEPARRMQQFDTLGRTREMFPYSKENTDLTKTSIEANAKMRESAMAGSRDRTAALKSLTDLAKFRSGQAPEMDDPTGAREGGVLGFGSHAKRVPNPAYDDLTDSMRAAYDVLGVANPDAGAGGAAGAGPAGGGKTMSRQDLEAFASENRMTVDQAASLAAQHGWTVR